MKTLKVLMRKTSVYAVYNSDENTLICVITCKPEDDEKAIDITPLLEQIVREENAAYSATLHSLPDVILTPDMNGCQTFGATIQNEENDESPDERTFEICAIPCY